MEDDTIKKDIVEIKGILKGHDQKFDKIDKRFEGIDQRFEGIDQRLDKMTDLLFEHDNRLEKIEAKVDKIETKVNLIDGIVQSQDEVLKILYRMEAEQAANKSRSDRHEERIENLEHDVKKIKVAIA